MIVLLISLIILCQIFLVLKFLVSSKDIIFIYVISYLVALVSLPVFLFLAPEHANTSLMIIAMILHIPLFVLGFIITSKFFLKESSSFDLFAGEKLEKKLFTFMGGGLLISFTLQLGNGASSLPLFVFLSANEIGGEFAGIRSQYFNENGFLGLFFHYSRAVIAPVLICLIVNRVQKKTAQIFDYLFLVIIVLHNALTTALAPVANLAFATFIYIYLTNEQLKLGKLGVAFMLILLFPILIESLVSSESFYYSAQNTVLKIFNRFSYDQVDRINTYFETFGNNKEHMGGVGNKIYRLITGSQSSQSIANIAFLAHLDDYKPYYEFGNLNANFLAFHFADFGFEISLLLNVIWGAIFGFFQAPLSSLKQTNLVKIILTVSMLSLWRLMGTQPTTVLFSGAVVLLIGLYVLRKRY